MRLTQGSSLIVSVHCWLRPVSLSSLFFFFEVILGLICWNWAPCSLRGMSHIAKSHPEGQSWRVEEIINAACSSARCFPGHFGTSEAKLWRSEAVIWSYSHYEKYNYFLIDAVSLYLNHFPFGSLVLWTVLCQQHQTWDICCGHLFQKNITFISPLT